MVNLPNLISLGRLVCVPVLVWLLLNSVYLTAFWLFVAAGLSDALDGYIAKQWEQTSALGTYLDPLADKALLVGVYVTLGHVSQIPLWLVILVVFRDVIIIGGVILLHISMASVRMKPLLVSKVNTALQIGLALWVLAELGYGQFWGDVKTALIYCVGVSTVISGGAYIVTLFSSDVADAENPR